MAKNYTYPRIEISHKALRHSNIAPQVEDNTSAFFALKTDKGPTDKISVVNSISEFTSIYGNVSFEENGQTAINLYNWINTTNSGTAYVYRLLDTEYYDKPAVFVYTSNDEDTKIAKTKYCGKMYENLDMTIKSLSKTASGNLIFTVQIGSGNSIETFPKMNETNYVNILSASEFISDVDLDLTLVIDELKSKDPGSTIIISSKYDGERQEDAKEKSQDELLKSFWGVKITSSPEMVEGQEEEVTEVTYDISNSMAYKLLSNNKEYPVENVLDAGYPVEVKHAISLFVSDGANEPVRPDMFAWFDVYEALVKDGKYIPQIPTNVEDQIDDIIIPCESNETVYYGRPIIFDSIFTDRDIYVTPTYHISSFVPYNDKFYGPQKALAGLNYTKIIGLKGLDSNPTPDDKEAYYTKRINYYDKTSRDCSFGSQQTYDNSTEDNYTGLSSINNARVLQRIKKDLTNIGRQYLFEFNDIETLNKMSISLNKYLNQWKSNRAICYGYVDVDKDPYSEETVKVQLEIKFNPLAKTIKMDIVID